MDNMITSLYDVLMNENQGSYEAQQQNILKHIDHTIKVIDESGFAKDIDVKPFRDHLEKLVAEIKTGLVVNAAAEQKWYDIDTDVQQTISLRKQTRQGSNSNESPSKTPGFLKRFFG